MSVNPTDKTEHRVCDLLPILFMMTSSNGNIFRVTGPLCGEFTGHRWIPLTKASDTGGGWGGGGGGGLSNCRAIGKVYTRILRIRDFTRSCDKTSTRLVNRRPEWLSRDYVISWYYFSLLSSTSYWTNITDAGDLSHHDAHVTSQ